MKRGKIGISLFLTLFLIIFPVFSYNVYDSLNLDDRALIIYNSNANDSREIAEYYADARGINHSYLCEVKLPTGQFATAEQFYGTRKTIVEDCICELISEKPNPCNSSTISQIANVSNITHLVIIRGIPPRLTGTGWSSDSEEPSLDYYLAYMIYREGNLTTETTGGSHSNLNYWGSYDDAIDFQTSDFIGGFSRSLNNSLDRMMAYGRIEAMDKNRTINLIDRIIESENEGISGNFFTGIDSTSFDFFRTLTDNLGSECDYNSTKDSWNSSLCKVGSSNGQIPGESSSTMSKVLNAGIFLNFYYDNNGHSAFDGFTNMLNWRKDSTTCIPLCKNTADVEACKQNSTDYFQEINTDCVGVSSGFLGWQLRSWPVQYYGFWPYGWTHYSGGNGAYEKTPPRVLGGDSFKNEIFSDDNYLRFGQDDAVENSICVLQNGTQTLCNEIIGINLVYATSLINQEILGSKNYSLRYRHRNLNSTGARIYNNVYATTNTSGYVNYVSTFKDISSGYSDWNTQEINFTINKDGEKLNYIYISFLSYLSSAPKGWFELDGVELIDRETGTNLIDYQTGSFNGSFEQTTSGDWAANVIDRLGGIAWWGSSSHFITGGYAFYGDYNFVGSFYSGRTLGESLLITRSQMSGIIYGDPLYRPSSTKLYINKGLNSFNDVTEGYRFDQLDLLANETVNVSINAFNGKNYIDSTNWNLTYCNQTNLTLCDSQNSWSQLSSGVEAVFSYDYELNLSEFIPNLTENSEFMLKLDVSKEGEEDKLVNYGYFYYGSCLDADGDGYGEYCEAGSDCDDTNNLIWQNILGYVDADGDGYGVGELIEVCSGSSIETGYSLLSGDCDDTNISIWKNLLVFQDSDGDDYGIGEEIEMCSPDTPLAGYSLLSGDCDDTNISIWKNLLVFRDVDGDGYGAGEEIEMCSPDTVFLGYSMEGGDCDDTRISINPAAVEICNSYDDDCDGSVNENAVCCGNGQCDGIYDSSCSSECSSSTSSGGGGGGGGGIILPILKNDSTQIIINPSEKNEEKNIIEFDETEIEKIYTFKIDAEEHSIRVINFSNDKITLEIKSEPIIVEILNGEIKKIDVDKDGNQDISIKYSGVLNGKIILEVKIINPNRILDFFIGGMGLIILIIVLILIGLFFHWIRFKKNKNISVVLGKNKKKRR